MNKIILVAETGSDITAELAQRYSGQIASRLLGNFTVLTFVGEDIRVLKNRGY